MRFTEQTISDIFGCEAAEDDSIEKLKDYYFKNDVYEKIHNDLPIRILVGHKGIGKSATLKVSCAENEAKNHVCIWIRPDDIMELCQEPTGILQMIRDWKKGLESIIFRMVMEKVGIGETPLAKPVGQLMNVITSTFRKKLEEDLDLSLTVKDTIQAALNKNKIFVYIDDLDRGWDGGTPSIQRISALLNAARDLTNDNSGLCFRITLRSDVYFLVRTSDESTDKIGNSVIWYSWTQHEILCMLAKRILRYEKKHIKDKQLLRLPQRKIAEYYDSIFESTFHSVGAWANIPTYKMLASMIRRRPRDLIKLCTLAARTAYENDHEKIESNDWLDNFDQYSQERLQDAVNEYKSELPSIERLLLGMKPSNRERRTKEEFLYTTETLLQKIGIIEGNQRFIFAKGTPASREELAAFMYKINFLVARKKEEGSEVIDRRYFEDNKYLSNRFVDFGYKWEVHPAFRWALYPDGGDNIFNALSVDNEI